MSNEKITIVQYDDKIIFTPVPPYLRKALTVMEKTLDSMEKLEMFAESGDAAVTYPGFAGMMVEAIMKNGGMPVVVDKRKCRISKGFPAPRLDAMYGFRYSQGELLTEALKKDCSGLIGAPTRYGKCLCAGTMVVMHDYDLKPVQDVAVGDMLMGPDGSPRRVVGLGRGSEQAYRIIPDKGEPFTCNASHILSLKATGGVNPGGLENGDIVNITVSEYLSSTKVFKRAMKLWWAALPFAWKVLPVDPRALGLWLGDINASSETESQFLESVAGICIREGEKRIPKEYLTSSVPQRMALLSGLVDSCSCRDNGTACELSTPYAGLSEDIVRLCRGLGFGVTRCKKVSPIKSIGFSGEYWSMQVYGAVGSIPCEELGRMQSDAMCSGFTVEDAGIQEYYGFELDGNDKLFMLWDHLVTHNTTLMVNTLRAFPSLPAIVVAPGVDLVNQLYDDLTGERGVKGREIRKITGSTSNKVPSTDGITVCTIDSLRYVDETHPRLLLADEPHSLVTDTRLALLNKFTNARRIGFGATLTGRFDGRDKLITGAFGPVLVNRTYKEAVAEGAICQLNVIFLKINLTPTFAYSRNNAYDKALFLNPTMANTVAAICKDVIPAEWQTLVFIANKAQADLYLNSIGEDTALAMAMTMSAKERAALTAKMRENNIKRCLCTNIFVQGVTFSDLMVLVNCNAGSKYTSTIQKPGRLAEIRPGKKCGIVIDFMFTPPEGMEVDDGEWKRPYVDSISRRKVYKNMGYGIYDAEDMHELKSIFKQLT